MPRGRQEEQPLVIVPNFGGWAQVTWRETVAYVRFVVDDARLQTLRIAELRVYEPWVRQHRELPLSRIENAVHADALVRFDLLLHIDTPIGEDLLETAFKMKASIERGMRYRLQRPTTRRLGDDFYRLVAKAYADAVAWGLNPRKTLATDSKTPADTVARWIRKARKDGWLTEAKPGKASGALPETGGTDG